MSDKCEHCGAELATPDDINLHPAHFTQGWYIYKCGSIFKSNRTKKWERGKDCLKAELAQLRTALNLALEACGAEGEKVAELTEACAFAISQRNKAKAENAQL